MQLNAKNNIVCLYCGTKLFLYYAVDCCVIFHVFQQYGIQQKDPIITCENFCLKSYAIRTLCKRNYSCAITNFLLFHTLNIRFIRKNLEKITFIILYQLTLMIR